MIRRVGSRRGLVLLAVLVIVALGAFVGAGLLTTAGAEAAGTAYSVRRVQARALAWSGVQAVAAELAAQRDELLNGEAPRLGERHELFRDDSGRTGVVRLLAVADGARWASEAGKLDLNAAPAEMLAKLPGVGEDLARRIAAAREERAFASVEDLLRVEGVTPALLDPAGGEELAPAFDAPGSDGAGAGAESAADWLPPDERGLAQFVTVFAFDPNVQAGLGENAEAAGRVRFPVWAMDPDDDELAALIGRRFDARPVSALRQAMRESERAEEWERLFLGAALPAPGTAEGADRREATEPAAALLDWLTVERDLYRLGRVDVNAAPAEVLACIPGIDADAAAQIVSLRERVQAEARRTPLWPYIEGVLTREEMATAARFLTTRSMQWRVRLEAGFLPGSGEVMAAPEAEEARSGAEAALLDRGAAEHEDRLLDAVTLEVVIDVAGPRPRIASMRDVTLLPLVRRVRAERAAAAPEADERWALAAEPEAEPLAGVDEDGGAGRGGVEPRRPDERRGATGPGGADAGEETEQRPAPVRRDPGMVDRRSGRWTARPRATGGASPERTEGRND